LKLLVFTGAAKFILFKTLQMSFSFSNQRRQLPNLSLPFHAGLQVALPVALPVGFQGFRPLQIQAQQQAQAAHIQAQAAHIQAQAAHIQAQQQAPQGQSVASLLNGTLRKANQRSFSGASYVP
jgi:hypothetical protein